MNELENEQSILEVSSQAQDLVINIERMVGWVRAFVLIAIMLPIVWLWTRSHVNPSLQALYFSLSGMLLIIPYFFLRRAKHRLDQLRLKINRLYVHHKSKSPETCGSMDPHFTRARN